eukprot:4728489-Amphidinium_carterae.1
MDVVGSNGRRNSVACSLEIWSCRVVHAEVYSALSPALVAALVELWTSTQHLHVKREGGILELLQLLVQVVRFCGSLRADWLVKIVGVRSNPRARYLHGKHVAGIDFYHRHSYRLVLSPQSNHKTSFDMFEIVTLSV